MLPCSAETLVVHKFSNRFVSPLQALLGVAYYVGLFFRATCLDVFTHSFQGQSLRRRLKNLHDHITSQALLFLS